MNAFCMMGQAFEGWKPKVMAYRDLPNIKLSRAGHTYGQQHPPQAAGAGRTKSGKEASLQTQTCSLPLAAIP